MRVSNLSTVKLFAKFAVLIASIVSISGAHSKPAQSCLAW